MKKQIVNLFVMILFFIPFATAHAENTNDVDTTSHEVVQTEDATEYSQMEEISLSQSELFTGESIADYIQADENYRFQLLDKDSELLFEKTDLIFSVEQVATLKKLMKDHLFLYFDLGDGQYVIPVENIQLKENVLLLKAEEVLPYEVFFHQGHLTASGLIIQDSTDPIEYHEIIEFSDISKWLEDDSGDLLSEHLAIAIDQKRYWSSKPYYEGRHAEIFDQQTSIPIGAYTLSSFFYDIHLNIVPRNESASKHLNASSQTSEQHSNQPEISSNLIVSSESVTEGTSESTPSEFSMSTTTMMTTENPKSNLPSTGSVRVPYVQALSSLFIASGISLLYIPFFNKN